MSIFLEGELKRPLPHNAKTHWEAMLEDVTLEDGTPAKSVHWIARSNGPMGLIGGDIKVIPGREEIFFLERREGEWESYKDIETLLRRLALFQWGEPDHFDKVCQDLLALQDGTSLSDVLNGWQELFEAENP